MNDALGRGNEARPESGARAGPGEARRCELGEDLGRGPRSDLLDCLDPSSADRSTISRSTGRVGPIMLKEHFGILARLCLAPPSLGFNHSMRLLSALSPQRRVALGVIAMAPKEQFSWIRLVV